MFYFLTFLAGIATAYLILWAIAYRRAQKAKAKRRPPTSFYDQSAELRRRLDDTKAAIGAELLPPLEKMAAWLDQRIGRPPQ